MAGNLTAMIAAAFSGGAAPPVTTDPYFDYTTLLLPGNGTNGAQNNTFLDGSTNNFTITRNGNTTQGTFSPFSQTGWGNYFDGTGDYLTANGGTAANLGTTWTVECWLYPTNVSGTGAIVNVNINTANQGINIYRSGATITVDNGGSAGTGPSGGTLVANTWQHVAVVADGTNTKIYLNGSQVGSTFSGTVTSGTPTHFWIGSAYTGISLWAGYISNVRIVKGVAVYTGAFTPPTSPLAATQSAGTNISAITGTQTSLLTCQSNRFIDNSSNNFTITRNGDTSVVAFSPFNPTSAWSASTVGGSGYFDGSGDYLATPSNAAFGFGTGDYTIEGLVFPIPSGKIMRLLEFSSGGDNFELNSNGTAYTLGGVSYYNGSAVVANGSAGLIQYAWNHIVIQRTSGTVRVYVNALSVLSTGTTPNTSARTLYIGGLSSDATFSLLYGYLASFRIVKGSAVYSGTSTTVPNFTLPTSPLTAITNTSLLLNFTNAGIYDATSKNDLETVGNAQISNTTAKFGSTSMYFDGTGDYLTSNPATTDMYAFGGGDFTIEMWIRWNSLSGTQVFYDQRPPAGGVYPTLYMSGTTLIYYANGANRITGSTLSTNQWYHIAVARSGTSTKLFVDGVQSGSTYTDSNVYLNAALRPFIGGDGTNIGAGINAYMQDVRVTKGYARYTANFTPPTAAFPTL